MRTLFLLAALALGWAWLYLDPGAIPALALSLWYVAASLVAGVAFVRDKRAARGDRRRTPERTLLALVLVGGFPGAWLAARRVRHKTRKVSFVRAFRWRVLGHCAVCLAVVAAAHWML